MVNLLDLLKLEWKDKQIINQEFLLQPNIFKNFKNQKYNNQTL